MVILGTARDYRRLRSTWSDVDERLLRQGAVVRVEFDRETAPVGMELAQPEALTGALSTVARVLPPDRTIELHARVRQVAIETAARASDLRNYAGSPDGRFSLGMLLAVLATTPDLRRVYRGKAAAAVRAAFGANPPRIDDYTRPAGPA